MSKIQFKITNLDCPACIKLSKTALEDINGVTKADVDLATGSAFIEANREVAWDEIVSALKSVGKVAGKIN